jgi:hypothetical protein
LGDVIVRYSATTLSGLVDFFFLPLALALPFLPPLHSTFVDQPDWVNRQLGHADTTMVRKHYGRWIPKDTKSMAGIVSKMLGFRTD